MIKPVPVRIAESAMEMDEVKGTGGFGPVWATGGTMECRVLEDEDIGVFFLDLFDLNWEVLCTTVESGMS